MSKKTIIFNRCKSNPYTGTDRPMGLQEVKAPRISRQLAYEGGNVVIPTHWLPLAPKR
jgi:hypothetical protein